MKSLYKKLLILTVIISGSLTTVSSANAGFVDWVTEDSHKEETNITKSFNYAFALFDDNDKIEQNTTPVVEQKTEVTPAPIKQVKAQPNLTPKARYTVEMTAYSSTPDQTDDSPFITASNTYVRDGIVALNGFPFKTKVQFPELFPGKTFVVEDRMNKRYSFENTGKYRVDVWFADRDTAIKFGYKRAVTMVVVADDSK